MELKIYNQQGVFKTAVSPSDSDRHVKEVMNDNILNLSFTLYEYVELGVNDYVDFEGERFTLLEDYKPEQKSTVEYAYSCKFYGIESELKKAKVLKMVDGDDELSFSYEGQLPILQKLNFSLQNGEKLAILGESGSGKTTLFHLLLRLWEPDQGRLSLNSRSYTEYSAAEIRSYFAAAAQSCYIFNETIRECFQRLYPGIADETIWQALEIAQLAAVLREHPDGLERKTGPDGALLSGGQRQRLLLALAFASPAPILLLDEPTAGLDAANSAALTSSFLRHFAQRTLLVITHDQQLADKMDRCLYLSPR